MEIINKIEEYTPAMVEGIEFDIMIASSGYESRAVYLEKNFKLKSNSKIAFGFDNYIEHANRINNDNCFKQAGYLIISASGNTDTEVLNFLKTFEFQNNNINILIDYSCMTRVWYSSILKYFYDFDEANVTNINLFFSYSQSQYVEPPKESIPNKYVSPINNHYSISTPQKPTALIIGLGNEEVRAFGLKELFDAETYIFYTDSSENNKFSSDVERCNKELLNLTPEDNIFKYPLQNLSYLHLVLNFLCKKLKENFKTVIAPCGPKPFTLVALLNSLLVEDTSVWRISAGEKAPPVNRDANGKVLISKIQLKGNSIKSVI